MQTRVSVGAPAEARTHSGVDVLVQGDGCVGRALALALAAQGLRVGLVGRARVRPADVRAYALNAASQHLLQQLRVWEALPPDARTPVRDMRIHLPSSGRSGTGRLDFSAWESHAEQLAWIVDAAELEAQLDAALQFAPHVQRLTPEQAQGMPRALLALCEGAEAGSRQALGVDVRERPYGHHGLAARLQAELPHQGRAWQWFTPDGDVLALLPLDRPAPGQGFALVWSQPQARAEWHAQMAPADFEAALQARTGFALRLCSPRVCWPLVLMQAEPTTGPGFALLGDCAHRVHPLAGQGLNLGLADVAALAQVLAAREPWRALGDAKLLRRYERARSADTRLMAGTTDALWLGLTQSPPWVRGLAAQGASWLNRVSPLKRWLSQRAMGPAPLSQRAASHFPPS